MMPSTVLKPASAIFTASFRASPRGSGKPPARSPDREAGFGSGRDLGAGLERGDCRDLLAAFAFVAGLDPDPASALPLLLDAEPRLLLR